MILPLPHHPMLEHLAMSGDVYSCHNIGWGMILVSGIEYSDVAK